MKRKSTTQPKKKPAADKKPPRVRKPAGEKKPSKPRAPRPKTTVKDGDLSSVSEVSSSDESSGDDDIEQLKKRLLKQDVCTFTSFFCYFSFSV